MLVLSLAACAGKADRDPAESDAPANGPETVVDDEQTAVLTSDDTAAAPPAESEAGDPEQNRSKVLAVAFSATGTTRGAAEKIAAIENADLYEIKAAREYTSDDLNRHDSSRTTLEQNDKNVRPEIGSESISLEGYEKISIGFPVWRGEEPRILDTFAESYMLYQY